MNDVGSTTGRDDNVTRTSLQRLRSLGTSPAGESYVAVRPPDDDALLEDSDPSPDRLVVKKLTRARLPSPERFRQKFAALCRLDHPNLCAYRELFLGETASRITRDFVDGLPLDEYLLRPITDAEEAELAQRTSTDAVDESDDVTDLDEDDETISDEAVADDSSPNHAQSLPADPDTGDTGNTDASAAVDDTDTAGENPAASTPEVDDDNGDDDDGDDDCRPTTLEIPASLMEDSGAADRALDLLIIRLRQLIPQLIDALEYLHRFGHAHGNLTPSNILITDDERVVLTDYGLYPELDIPAAARRRHAGYFAPETEDGDVVPESDLYSLGAILFEILADQPYGDRRHCETADGTDPTFTPVYLSEIVPHCPATWVDLIHALLAPEPEDRPRLDEVHRQLAATEARSVNIPADLVQQSDSLYGRNDCLDRLTECAQACSRDSSLRLAVVEGGPGVGKTALLDALAGQSAQRGWIIFHGRCFQREPVSYQGWEDVVDRLSDIIDDLPQTPRDELASNRRRASRLFPQLADSHGDRPSIPRQCAVDGFRDLLVQLSEQRPILICFDDIHWAGPDSTRLLADLAERPAGMRVMVVATWRDIDDEQRSNARRSLWSELSTAPLQIDRVYMEGFSREEAHDYVLHHAAHLTLRQQQQVLRRSGLNPLLIDELIHEFDDHSPGDGDDASNDGSLTNSGDSLRADEAHGSDDDLDHHLRPFILQRLTDLSRAERLVVQLLAVASSPLSAELLARALERELGTQTADLVSGREVVESLIDQRLVRTARPSDGALSPATPTYVVIHNLARRIILHEIGQDHHARLCGLIAEALSEDEDDDADDDLRFEYLLRAGRGEEASRAAVLAARSALDRHAHHRAARLWRWLADHDGLDERDQPRFAEALLGAADFDAAIGQLDALVPAESSATEFAHRRRKIEALLSAGRREEAVDATADALDAAAIPYGQRSPFGRLLEWPRRIATTTARWSDVDSLATDTAPDDEDRHTARLLETVLESSPLLLSECRDDLERHFAHLGLRSRFGPLVARDRLQMIGEPWLPFLTRSLSKVQRWCEQALTLAERFDDPLVRARCREIEALVARHRGDLDAAVDAVSDVEQTLERHSVCAPRLECRTAMLHADTILRAGDVDHARRITDRAFHRFRRHHSLTALIALASADELLLTGSLDVVEQRLGVVEDFIGDDENCLLHLWYMDRRTRLLIARGQADVAVAHWDLLLDRIYSRRLRRLPAARFLIHLNYSRALAALAGRQQRLGESHFPRTLRRLRRALRRLGDLEQWLSPGGRARFFRLRALYCLLRDRPRRALRNVERADDVLGDDTPELLAATNQEARGFVLTQLERPNARSLLDDARARYEALDVFLPMVLDGWPVPNSHARLEDES